MNFETLQEHLRGRPREEILKAVSMLPPAAAELLLRETGIRAAGVPDTPLLMAQHLNEGFTTRPHLELISDVIADAVKDVENGISRRIAVSQPPRSGKTTMTTLSAPAWMLAKHPDWPIALTSHDSQLATSWGRQIRRWTDEGKLGDIEIARDAGAASSWETTKGGKVLSLSLGGSFTGRGAKVLVIDDPHKDFVDAHSSVMRQNVWDWWLSVALTRLEPPSLVIVTMTRWHEDDFVGRLLSREHPGDPDDWDVVRLPAIAEDHEDALGREPGEPLHSPLLEETDADALIRWADQKAAVGTYVWGAMFQQRPAPAAGQIFDISWWRYWTTDPSLVKEDGTVRLLDLDAMAGADVLDSWDLAFKGNEDSDYVVGQRWARLQANRYLIEQKRGRWSFTQTLKEMRDWSTHGLLSRAVTRRLIEDKANGPAIMDTLRDEIAGIKPVQPMGSKEARARAVTAEVESGNVYLPHPTEFPWVADLLSELRAFPTGAHDDQVDTLTQALTELRGPGKARISNPAGQGSAIPNPHARLTAARTNIRRSRGG